MYARSAGVYRLAPTPIVQPEPDAADSTYEGSSIRAKGTLNTFGLYAQIIGVYDSGLVAAPARGKQLTSGSNGVETNFGANASHLWRRGKLDVEYRGSYRQYSNAPAFDGLDQFLRLSYSGTLLRHVSLDLKNTLGTTTLANGAFSYFPLSTLDRLGIPTNDLYDSRKDYLQSRIDLTWRESERLSFDLGGDGFVVRRQSLLLAGLNGYGARASVAYRFTPRQTISANYDSTYFDFQRTFGNSRLETSALGYSIGLSREWDLSTLVGGVRVDTLGLTPVSLQPAIAALIGENSAFVTFTSVRYVPVAEVRLMRQFRTAALTLDLSSTVTPGNGLYLTSRQTSGAVAYSYIATRSLQARGNVGYSQLSALGQALDRYSNLEGGIQILYRLTGNTYLDVRYDYRHYTTGNEMVKMDSNRVSLGVAFSLGETSTVAW
jgi:hypothetical protein